MQRGMFQTLEDLYDVTEEKSQFRWFEINTSNMHFKENQALSQKNY